MTESRMLIGIFLLGLLAVAVAMLGLAALGADGSLLALGGIVPMILASFASSQVVARFDDSGRRRR